MENRRLKVGLFIDTFFPTIDGVIMVVDNYARRLQKYCDVVVFAPKERKDFDDSTLPYKVVRCNKKFATPTLDYDAYLPGIDKDFKQAMEDEKLDLVHIHDPFSICEAGQKYAKKHGIPCIATMHSQYKQDFIKILKIKPLIEFMVKYIMRVFNKCDECWAVNDEIAKLFVEYGAKKLPRTQNNGTDMLYYEDRKAVLELKQKYNIQDDEKILLFIGRLTRLKNILFIADSLKILKDKKFKFKMIFVGTGTDEDMLKEKIEELGLQNDVILTGKLCDREEIVKHYNLADLFLFPSLYDASSLVQIEAAAQKTPTLFLRGAKTTGTVTENVNGYIGENSPEEYANKIIEIFSKPEQYKTISENAYRDLYVHWDDAVKKVYNDYLNAINKKREEIKEKQDKKIKTKNVDKKEKTIKKEKTEKKIKSKNIAKVKSNSKEKKCQKN